jgi:hypothetical protein
MTKETLAHKHHIEGEVIADLGTSKIISQLMKLKPIGKFKEKESDE